jgi:hypothetical protein
MNFLNIAMGWFLGFMFGVGCALAVMYSIYQGGYRKAVEDSLKEPRPEEYTALVLKTTMARQKSG